MTMNPNSTSLLDLTAARELAEDGIGLESGGWLYAAPDRAGQLRWYESYSEGTGADLGPVTSEHLEWLAAMPELEAWAEVCCDLNCPPPATSDDQRAGVLFPHALTDLAAELRARGAKDFARALADLAEKHELNIDLWSEETFDELERAYLTGVRAALEKTLRRNAS